MPTLKSYTFASHTSQPTSQSLQKSMPFQPHRHSDTADKQTTKDRRAACNTGLAKVAVQCSADTFVVNQTLVLRINICGENRHLRQARNRWQKILTSVRVINFSKTEKFEAYGRKSRNSD